MKSLYLIVVTFFMTFVASTTAFSQGCAAAYSFGETNITIQFADESTSFNGDPIVAWNWDFGDGTTSTEQNPLHTFPEGEDYLVCLEITTQSGCTDQICMDVEVCILLVDITIGNCNGNDQIPITINVSDPFDRAKDINIFLDGVLLPGSPFEIEDDLPVVTTATVPGDGLQHTVLVQSTDVGTCSTTVMFSVPDCGSNCFLSSMSVNPTGGTTHVVQVGDNFFSPVNTTITIGDVTQFQWVGDGHSTTSDATSGPDSWNSGVLGFGSSYQVNITNPGSHPYYCIPHGGPGGAGMSGTIIANCPPGNQIELIVSFNTSSANPAGYNLLIDGNPYPGSPFAYTGTGPQSVNITLPGDGANHVIEVQDVADPTCILSRDFLSPDCGAAPTCSLSLSAVQTGGCDAANNVSVEVTVNSINGGANGFNILVDGNLAIGSPFTYNGSGITVVNIGVSGDGQSHTIQAVDVADGTCTGSTNITTDNCTIPCQLSNLLATTGSSTTHVVEVQDFAFSPQHITITAGDIVEWQWTGAVAHTSTSDATSGPDSWDSGLLNQGATYQSPVLNAGIHPYYCIPHGGPGGVGMSGTITVQADCTNGQVSVGLSFTEQGGGFGGYQILVDGNVRGSFNYDPSGNNTASVLAPGDGQSHSIVVQDIDDPTCSISTSVTTPDCNASTCQLGLSLAETGGCDANSNVAVELTISDTGGGASGFEVFVDGASVGTYAYSGTGTTLLTQNIIGDGQNHTVEVIDLTDGTCTATADLVTTNCTIPCQLSNLLATTGSSTTHVVEVQDFAFSPQHITITAGDIVEWQWTGAVAHTSTSDATSGPDSWDSGLLNQGTTYQSPVLNAGIHPYYCIPHGGPGGVGMSGTITVQADCTNGQVSVGLSFAEQGGGFGGYQILVDGNVTGSFNYDPSGNNTASVLAPGDGQSHSIVVQDIDDPTCSISTSVTTPDCNASTCQLGLSLTETGGCDANSNVAVELTISDTGGGASGFEVFVDGASVGTYAYSGTGTTLLTQNIIGDGQNHTVEVIDLTDGTCTATADLVTTNCTIPCQLSNLVATTGSSTTHVVEVQDFAFSPQHITITAGDIVEWQWTGAVAHTSTSDATSGPDSWDSGLLNQGTTYQSPVLNAGIHPYYCIPHGGPGGVGMSGTITVQADCTNGQVSVGLSFTEQGGGFGGYQVLVDGNVAGSFNYDPSGNNTASVLAPGDGQSHTIVVQDIDDPTCSISTSVTTPDCNASTCSLTLEAQEETGCDDNGNVTVQLIISDVGGGDSGFELFVDGNSEGTYAYSGTGETFLSQTLPGDGQNHSIEVVDVDDADCSAGRMILSPDCSIPCELTNLMINTGGGDPVVHTVEVVDFAFEPAMLNIQLGDIVRFVWTGVVAHTTTSDATSGPDAWDSGLLNQGATYEITLTSLGEHPYYCIPHGGPGGVGMSGMIMVNPPCNGGNYSIAVQFESMGTGTSGYEVLIDGEVTPESPFAYDGGGMNTTIISIPGDGTTHDLVVRDVDDPECTITGAFEVPNCEVPGPCSLGLTATQTADCDDNGEVTYQLDITSENTGGSGFNIRIDDLLYPGGPFPYGIDGDTSVNVMIAGIGQDRTILIEDVDSTLCTASQVVTTPQCGPECAISELTIGTEFDCENGFATVEISFSINNAGGFGYNLFLDGELLEGAIPYDDPSGGNTDTIAIPGDGNLHTLTVEDAENNLCSETITFTAPNCIPDCDFSNLQVEMSGPQVHVVEVLDFEFMPKDITVNVGDVVRWEWVGAVPHTATSDATSGSNVWNSGLLGQGAVFEVTISEAGLHRYYCIPHGGPGGIGMAGSINAVEDCEDGELTLNFTFDKPTGGINGYNVFVDGNMTPESPYPYGNGGQNQFALSLPAEGQEAQILLQDVTDPECQVDSTFVIPDCDDPCFGFEADFTYEVDHLTFEADFASQTIGATSWIWDFGDGQGAETEQPTHTYAEGGSYQVCLEVGNAEGCVATYCETIIVGEYLCQAAFSLETEGLTLTFADESTTTDAITNWNWDFGDLSVASEQHPVHTYDTLGLYEVCLGIEAGACVADTCLEIDLTNPCLLFQAAFSHSINDANLSVQFTDGTSGNAHQWLWGFGDGFTSNEQSPLHFYDAPGAYTVCLLVQDTIQGCNRSYCEVIQVGSPNTQTVEIRNKDLIVFPNPARANNVRWTIEGLQVEDFGKILDLKLYDVQGKTIMRDQITGRQAIPMRVEQPLSKGIYFLEIRSDRVHYLGKVMIL